MRLPIRKRSLFYLRNGLSKGVPNDSFGAHYSQLQTYQWLANLTELTSGDQYLAQRLTKFPVVQKTKS